MQILCRVGEKCLRKGARVGRKHLDKCVSKQRVQVSLLDFTLEDKKYLRNYTLGPTYGVTVPLLSPSM